MKVIIKVLVLVLQFQQMVWTIKNQFEPIKNVIYSISRQYRSSSTSLLTCHYEKLLNLHSSHPASFFFFPRILDLFFLDFFSLLNYSSPLSSTAMRSCIPYSHTRRKYVCYFPKNFRVHHKGQIYHYTHYSDEASEVCGHLSI